MTTLAYVLLGLVAMIILFVGVVGCLWIVQVLLNANEARQKG